MIKNAKNLLKTGETLDDLQLNDLFIIQNRRKYCFSSDSVLLSNFAKMGKKDFVVELCSGSGVVSILCNEKYHPKQILGIEIDEYLWDMSTRSLEINNIKNIEFLNLDLNNALQKISAGSVDKIVCNPPYFPTPKDKSNINEKYLSTKYEENANISQVMAISSKLLKFGGKMFVSFPAERLQILLSEAMKNNLVCKRLHFVCAKGKAFHIVLAEFLKGGGEGVNVSFESL